ncbi:MAG: MotA/TolQ/ExbB proton channel family protein [Clostridia bacterium]|nr:MotA/TolQ/ExbB proton channel family protein [Deltaproteobacteria bacterium]
MSPIDAVKHLLLESGAAWVLYFLGLLSLVTVVLVVERTLFYRAVRGDVRTLVYDLDSHLAAGDIESAKTSMAGSRSVAASIALAGLRLAARGSIAAEHGMRSTTAIERERLERWLAYLGTVGNNAPFVGLFGTVIGVIHAFEELGHSTGQAAAAAASQAASQEVMAAVAEALVATAVGIVVALPAVAFFNFFQRKVASILSEAEALSNIVLAYIGDKS